MTIFKRDEIIVLLGAGASVEAKIPASLGMINKIEELLKNNWSDYKKLYDYVKSAINYSDGIKGSFSGNNYNVERLVNTLDDLRKGDNHPLYPFIGAWNPKLSEVAGQDLRKISGFRTEIVTILRDDWVQLTYNNDANYFKGLINFQRQYQHPLRVFTLNYDLCVEVHSSEVKLERGFNNERIWDWRRFDDTTEDAKDLYLYKLHGSVDWTKDDHDNLIYKENSSEIPPDDVAIIFGTTYKLQYVDPFLFFAYEFRKWTLDSAKIIIAIGYGFGDEHINGILSQALNNNVERKLLSISPIRNDVTEKKKESSIKDILNIRKDDQIVCWGYGAKEFMTNKMDIKELSNLFPSDNALIPEVSS